MPVLKIKQNGEWVEVGGAGVSSWNDLTDRPFCMEDVVLVETTTIETTEDELFVNGAISINLEVGQTYKVIWDGNEYECVCENIGCPVIGNVALGGFESDSNEPFSISTYEGVTTVNTSEPGSHTVSVIGQTVKTLESKYLSEHLQFGEFKTGRDTLLWDGDTTGRLSVSVVSSEGREFIMCKVSDALPTMGNLINGCLIAGDLGQGFMSMVAYPDQTIIQTETGLIIIDGSGIGYGIWIVPEDNFHHIDDHCDFILPEKGIYFFKTSNEGYEYYYSSFVIPGYIGFTPNQLSIKQLDDKYLPEHSHTWDNIIDKPFGEVTTGSDTLAVNVEDCPRGMYLHRKASDAVPTMADLAKGVKASRYSVWGGHQSGDIPPDRIITDGRMIICDGVFIILLEDIGEFTKGTYFYKFDRTYTTSLTITGYTGFNETTTITKIDKKYLPDTMPEVTTEDNGKFLGVVDGVWAAASIPSAVTEEQVITMINNALGVIENGSY